VILCASFVVLVVLVAVVVVVVAFWCVGAQAREAGAAAVAEVRATTDTMVRQAVADAQQHTLQSVSCATDTDHRRKALQEQSTCRSQCLAGVRYAAAVERD